jgi:WD40 repeat protein
MPRLIAFLLVILFSFFSSSGQEVELGIQYGHNGRVDATCYSKDNKLLLSGGDKLVKLWDVQTGREIRSYIGHSGFVSCVAFSPDEKLILSSGGLDRTVRIWNTQSGKCLQVLYGHNDDIFSTEFSPDGKYVLSSSADSLFILWDVQTGKELKCFPKQKGSVNLATFIKKGREILSITSDTIIKIWDVATAKCQRELHSSQRAYNGAVDRDGKTLVTIGRPFFDVNTDSKIKKTFTVWDLESGKVLRSFPATGSSVSCICFHPDGKSFATTTNYGELWLWDVQTGAHLTEFKASSHANQVSFSSDGRFLASGGWRGEIFISHVKSGNTVNSLVGNLSSINVVCFSPNGKLMASGNSKGFVKCWDLEKGEIILSVEDRYQEITQVAFSPDGKYLLSGGGLGGNMVMRRIADGELIWRSGRHTNDITAICFSPDGKYVLSGGNNASLNPETSYTIKLWDIKSTGADIKTFKGHTRKVTAVRFSEDGKKIISGSDDNTIRQWDIESGNEEQKIVLTDGYTDRLAISTDGKVAASGWGDTIKIWDIPNTKVVQILKTRLGFGQPMTFSADGKKLFYSHLETIYEAEIATGSILQKYTGHKEGVKSLDVSQDEKYLLSSAQDKTIKLWNKSTGKELLTFLGVNGTGKDFLIITPGNYYKCSKGGTLSAHYCAGNKVYLLEQFDLRFNRPDLVLASTGLTSLPLIDSYHKAWLKRIKKMKVDTNSFSKTIHTPELSILNSDYFFSDATTGYILELKASDSLFPLAKLHVYVNGNPVYGSGGLSLLYLKTKELGKNIPLSILPKQNHIEAWVENSSGTSSVVASLTLSPEKEGMKRPVYQKPTGKQETSGTDLWVISIGVSKFDNPDMNLDYASKDAKDVMNHFNLSKTSYGKIHSYLLLDKQLSIDTLTKIRKKLCSSRTGDKVVVFYAGHGLLNKDLDYFLATSKTDFSNPENGGIPFETMQNILDSIPATDKVLFVDACHSGEIDKEESSLGKNLKPEQGVLKFRGFNSTQTTNTGSGNSFELMKELFTDPGKGSGAVVISSASGGEYALEGKEWKNGIFTYCLLSYLKKSSGPVKMSELRESLYTEVYRISGGKQHPTTREDNLLNDFLLW